MQRLDQGRALEIVQDLSDTLDTLQIGHAGGIDVVLQILLGQLHVGGYVGKFDIIGDLITPCLAGTVQFDLKRILRFSGGNQCLQALIQEVLQLLEQGVEEAVLVRLKALFLENVEHTLRGHLVSFDPGNHIGMLGQVADGLGGDVSHHLDGNDLLLVFDESLGGTNDGIKRDDGILDHLDPAHVDVSVDESLVKQDVTLAALDRVHEVRVELIRSESGQKVARKTTVNIFNFTDFCT